MNIEIANRLVELRKKSGLSQEDLASKLGLSRQAVSKWERAEASPDTDNLICLAKLYGVSLDELLNTEESIDEIVKEQVKEDASSTSSSEETNKDTSASKEEDKKANSEDTSSTNNSTKDNDQKSSSDNADYFHMGSDGLHFADDEDEGSLDSKGIHIKSKDGSYVNIDKSGIHIKDGDGKSYDNDGKYKYSFSTEPSLRKKRFTLISSISSGVFTLLCIIFYVLFGCLYPDPAFAWSIGWLVFLLIPLLTTFIKAIEKHHFCAFAFPVLVVGVYVLVGMLIGQWHPEWVMFLAIPVYYSIFGPIDHYIDEKRFLNGKVHLHVKKDNGKDDDDDDDDDDDVIDVDVK